jgi:hypothetical protein
LFFVKNKKKGILIAIILFIVAFLPILTSITATAASTTCTRCQTVYNSGYCPSCRHCTKCNTTHEEGTCHLHHEKHKAADLNGTLKKKAYEMNVMMYSGGLFYKSDPTNNQDIDTFTLLRLDIDDQSSPFHALYSFAEQAYTALSSLAVILCIINGLMKLLEIVSDETVTPEKIFRLLVKMFGGIVLIRNGFDIVMICVDYGTVLFSHLSDSQLSETISSGSCNFNLLLNGDVWTAMGEILSLILPYLAMAIVKLLISIIAWMRLLEVMVRLVFAPIPMADMMYEGSQSNGFLYLKKLTASIVQASIILAGSAAYSAIINAVSNSVSAGVSKVMMITMAYVLATVILKSQTMANDLLGVG